MVEKQFLSNNKHLDRFAYERLTSNTKCQILMLLRIFLSGEHTVVNISGEDMSWNTGFKENTE